MTQLILLYFLNNKKYVVEDGKMLIVRERETERERERERRERERETERDKEALLTLSVPAIPDATVISSRYGQLALRLHFRAEHTNVLIVQAEILQGCLTETEIETMDMSLVLQERPVPWVGIVIINEIIDI